MTSEYVQIGSAITTTAISTLTFTNSGNSTLCNTTTSSPAGTPNTWHIFKTVVTNPHTIWAVKLNGSDFPATLDASNFKQCNPTGNFDTTNGCIPSYSIFPPPSISAPIFNLNTPAKIFGTEVK